MLELRRRIVLPLTHENMKQLYMFCTCFRLSHVIMWNVMGHRIGQKFIVAGGQL